MAATLRSFADFPQLCGALADRIVSALGEAVAVRGEASLIVPGGSTPAAFFDVLAKRALSWDKVTVGLTDERWVPPESDRSNEHLVRTRLLVGRASAARFVPLKTDVATARAAETEIGARVAAIPHPFDFVLAGMGGDGHTASLIPGSQRLDAGLDRRKGNLAVAVMPPASTGMGERITLTRRALLDARAIAILIRGDAKRRALEQAQSGDNVREMPVRVFLDQDKVPVEIFWSAG